MASNVQRYCAVDKRLLAVYRSSMVGIFAALLAALLSLVSCSGREAPSVDRENLFSLSIGRLEDQIDLFGLENRQRALKTRLAMRDGIFYISDGNGEKVVRFTSYGDLLSMIYNSDTNPAPLTLKTELDEDDVVTRRAIAYPLNEPGEIAIDSRKHLYIEDRLPQDRRSYDSERRTLLDGVLLHFDENGRFLEYLGREGVGGSPFPFIMGVYVSVDDEIAVVCRLSSVWNIFWFDKDGNPLFLIRMDRNELPLPQGRNVRPSLDSIVAAPDARRLYIKIDYYRETVDESTDTRAGIGYDSSFVWVMSVEDGSYPERLEVPAYERTEMENDKKVVSDCIYALIGAARGGKVLFSVPETGGYALLLLSVGARDQKRGFIRVDDDELMFNTFFLSSDGILSALLSSEFEAKVVWWRTDRLLGEPRQ